MIQKESKKVYNRISLLLDEGSFHSIEEDDDTELIGGTGTINGRSVTIIAINPESIINRDPVSILKKEISLLDLAEKMKTPVIHLADRPLRVAKEKTTIPLGVLPTYINPEGAGGVFSKFARLSGVVPRIAIVFSPIATTLTYPVAECDTAVMVAGSGMSLGRPDMVKLMTGDKSSYEEYGGARMHAEISGLCDMFANNEADALEWTRNYLTYFPSHYKDRPPVFKIDMGAERKSKAEIKIPDDPYIGFDMCPLLLDFVDEGSLLFHRSLYAKELITAFARVRGYPLGIIANNSIYKGGILFPESCRKLASFTSLCNSFNIPLLFLADLPGFMVGKTSEQEGIVQLGALVLSTIAQLSVPHISVIVRKAYTAGLYAMGGTGFNPDRLLAFEGAELTIYGEKAIRKLSQDSCLTDKEEDDFVEKVKEKSSLSNYINEGFLDAIIKPSDLREEVFQFLKRDAEVALIRTEPRRVLCI